MSENCPRCGTAIAATEFYGPCEACRLALRQLRPPAPDPLWHESWDDIKKGLQKRKATNANGS